MGSWLKGNIELLLPIFFPTPMGGILVSVQAKWGLLHAAWVSNGDLITRKKLHRQPFATFPLGALPIPMGGRTFVPILYPLFSRITNSVANF